MFVHFPLPTNALEGFVHFLLLCALIYLANPILVPVVRHSFVQMEHVKLVLFNVVLSNLASRITFAVTTVLVI